MAITTRKPFQGLLNIIRFNWHFYVAAGVAVITFFLVKNLFSAQFQAILAIGAALATLNVVVSLAVSYYAYDVSNLYQLPWLAGTKGHSILNINAGFDETSAIVQQQYPVAQLTVCDFYDPARHTEVSIKRARAAYPPTPGTVPVTTHLLPFGDGAFDLVLAILSAHEVRDAQERAVFFKEIHRVTQAGGQVMVIEHLRDWPNFLAYNIGFFHFYARSSWLRTFEAAHFSIKKEIKTTPFITTFILGKHGDTL